MQLKTGLLKAYIPPELKKLLLKINSVDFLLREWVAIVDRYFFQRRNLSLAITSTLNLKIEYRIKKEKFLLVTISQYQDRYSSNSEIDIAVEIDDKIKWRFFDGKWEKPKPISIF